MIIVTNIKLITKKSKSKTLYQHGNLPKTPGVCDDHLEPVIFSSLQSKTCIPPHTRTALGERKGSPCDLLTFLMNFMLG